MKSYLHQEGDDHFQIGPGIQNTSTTFSGCIFGRTRRKQVFVLE
jgi:hypothetical protein